jgi:uncharacterized membrane protein YedE/YeeE
MANVSTSNVSDARPARGLPAVDGQTIVLGIAIALIAAGAAVTFQAAGWRLAALWLVGSGLGLALYHASFGFAAGFRNFLAEGRSAHIRAQLLMLAAAVLLFFPALAWGTVAGQPVRGFIFPVGLEVALGAFLFGIGMQIAGGCGSGTLYTVAGGGTRMLMTLVFFVAGATLAAFTFETWGALPKVSGISLIETFGVLPALALNLAVFAAVAFAVTRIEKALTGRVEPILSKSGQRFLTGPWPYAWAALALAVLNFATLLLAGRPWGITQAFAVWGSHAVDRFGFDDPNFWAYWDEPTRAEALHRRLLTDTTTVMNVGLIVGALAATGLAGKFAPVWKIGFGPALGSILGGLLLGFGAIVATGCNVSAYFSGVASGSLHGWLWIAAALPGIWVGTKLRPLFGLEPRRT